MTDLSAEALQKVRELKKSYINSFPEKILHLESCWQKIEVDGYSIESLEALRKICHKIAGSSGSYEFFEISKMAAYIEEKCINMSEVEVDNLQTRQSELKGCYMSLVKLLKNHI